MEKELMKLQAQFERRKKLEKYLNKPKIIKHAMRIMKCIGEAFIPEVKLKVNLDGASCTCWLSLETNKLRLESLMFKAFCDENYPKLISVKISSSNTMVYSYPSRYYQTGLYDDVIRTTPLFYKTFEMTDKEFDLWFRLQ